MSDYTPFEWHDEPVEDTPIDAAALNRIEEGIAGHTHPAYVRTVNGDAPDEDGNVVVAGGGGSTGLAIYGDAHLGDVVISEDTDLDHTIYGHDVTVQAGVTVNLQSWPVYATGTLTIEAGAVIHDDAWVDENPHKYATQIQGGPGGAGGAASADRPGSAEGSGTNSWYDAAGSPGLGVGGAGGGAGLADGGIGLEGDPGIVLQRSALGGGGVQVNVNVNGLVVPKVRVPWAGGCGGGGGAACGGDLGEAVGGNGGAGGCVVLLAAHHIVNAGTIRAAGGDGADGTMTPLPDWSADAEVLADAYIVPAGHHVYHSLDGGTSAGSAPTWTDDGNDVADGSVTWNDVGGAQGAGGGGGGQGGYIFLIYDTFIGTKPDSSSVPGGAGGAGVGSGANGGAGDAGHVIDLANGT